jgi:hypothetical protein
MNQYLIGGGDRGGFRGGRGRILFNQSIFYYLYFI